MPNSPLAKLLSQRRPALLDGGIATELQARGCVLHDRHWSALLVRDSAGEVLRLHRDYYSAGADIATTCSYQMSLDGLERELGWTREQAEALMCRSVALAAAARDAYWTALHDAERSTRPQPLIAASISSFGASIQVQPGDKAQEFEGAYIKPSDRYYAPGKDIKDLHFERLSVFYGISDIVLFETVPSLGEARLIMELLEEPRCHDLRSKRLALGLPAPDVVISFSCRDSQHTCAGDSIEDCARALDSCVNVTGIGINCTAPRHAIELVRRARGHTNKPIFCYPNSGEVWNHDCRCWDPPTSPTELFGPAIARALFEAGAAVIGGCCRTRPADIARIAEEFRGQYQR